MSDFSAPPPSYDELEREKLNPTEPSAPPPTQQGSSHTGYPSQQQTPGYPPQQGQFESPPPEQYGYRPPGQYAPSQYPQPQFQQPITAGGQPYVQYPTTVIYAGHGRPPGNSVVYMPNGQTARFNEFGAPIPANGGCNETIKKICVIGVILCTLLVLVVVLVVIFS